MDAERASSDALAKEVRLLQGQLDEARALGQAATDAYISALAGFGGVTSPFPVEVFVANVFSWMSANFVNLSNFVGKVADFAALSSATNLTKTL